MYTNEILMKNQWYFFKKSHTKELNAFFYAPQNTTQSSSLPIIFNKNRVSKNQLEIYLNLFAPH